jgi:hypothetical protein
MEDIQVKTQRVSHVVSVQRPETRNIKVVVFGLIFSLTVFALPAISRAVERFSSKGLSVFATFFSTDGCIETFASVSASDEVTHQPPGPRDSFSSAFISMTKSDQCEFTILLAAVSSPLCQETLADTDFEVGKNLAWATLNTTVKLYDSVSDSCIDVFIDLTWTATGSSTRQTNLLHDKSTDFMFIQKMTGTGRTAEASGTVSDGTTNFSPDPDPFGSIMNNSTGSVTIFK